MGGKILIVDDDYILARLVDQILTEKGYIVLTAGNGHEALRLLFEHKPDLVLLDVVMPEMDGWQTCNRIRDVSDVPIIILTGAQKAEDDIVRGLDCGADDYITKPVGNRELIARVQATLRRAELSSTPNTWKEIIYSDGYLTVNIAKRAVMIDGKQVKITPREFRLLVYLVENAGNALTHKQLLEKVWGWEYINDVDYVRIYISHLRQKIEPTPAQPRYIITMPGFGYHFQKPD